MHRVAFRESVGGPSQLVVTATFGICFRSLKRIFANYFSIFSLPAWNCPYLGLRRQIRRTPKLDLGRRDLSYRREQARSP